MKNLITRAIAEIEKQHTGNHLNFGENSIRPVFDGFSIANIPSSICHWLDSDTGEMLPGIALEQEFGLHFRHVILIVIDGLGLLQTETVYDRLKENPWIQRIQEQAIASALTSVIPSTTVAALTSIWTGCAPGSHGLVGYEMWLKELGMVVNYLPYSPIALSGKSGLIAEAGIPPENMFPSQTLGQILSENQVISRSYMPSMLSASNLTKAQMIGSAVIPYRRFGDLWANLKENLERDKGSRTYETIYWNDIDTYGHLMGIDNERVYFDLDQFFYGLEKTYQNLSKMNLGDTLILITADHGQIKNVPDPHRDLKNYPGFLDELTILPCGENRFTYFYPKSGKEKDIIRFVEEKWPNDFRFVSSRDMIQEGIFGEDHLHPDLNNRVGEMIAIAQKDAYFWWPNRPDKLHARHGGVSREEMLVPFTGIGLS
jgi:hypothetical protein